MIIDEKYFLYINIAILCIYAGFIIFYAIKGLVKSLISVLFSILGLVLAYLFCDYFASNFPILSSNNSILENIGFIAKLLDFSLLINKIIYFAIIFIVVKLLSLLLVPLIELIFKLPALKEINVIGGMIIGSLKATILILLLSLLLSLPVFKNGNEIKNGTFLKPIANFTENIYNNYLSNFIKDEISNLDLPSLINKLKEDGFENIDELVEKYNIKNLDLKLIDFNDLFKNIDFKNFNIDELFKYLEKYTNHDK